MPRAEELDSQFIDEQQFIERIFFQYKEYVKHLARNKCGDPNDVEDVVQSTWELLLKIQTSCLRYRKTSKWPTLRRS